MPNTGAAVTVVTGASSGMGQAVARRLAPTSEVLILADLRPSEVSGCEQAGQVELVECDVADPEAVAALAASATGAGGPVHRLVHAAGISPTMGDAARIFEVDLIGSALIEAAFEPVMGSGGAAVFFASMAAHLIGGADSSAVDALLADPLAPGATEAFVASSAVAGDPGLAYAWSKVGVLRLARRAAARWGQRGARINTLSPGTIDTPMGQQELAQQPAMHSMLGITPLARPGRAAELAAAVEFLVSDAASYVTGTDLLVDGGLVATMS